MKRNMARGSNREDLGTLATSVLGALVLLVVVSGPIAAQPPEVEHLDVVTIQNSYRWDTAMPLNGMQLVSQLDHPRVQIVPGATKIGNVIKIALPTVIINLPTAPLFGGAKVTTSCFPKRGRAIDLRTKYANVNRYGNWADLFKVPGERDCTYDYAVATLNGTYIQPANMPICTAPGSLDTHLCYAAWRSTYSSRASIGV